MGIGYWFLCDIFFKFTENFDIILQKYTWKAAAIFIPLKYVERNGTFGLFDTSVNGNVMLAYIHTPHSAYTTRMLQLI